MRLIDADKISEAKFHPLPYTRITPTDVDAESYKRGWNDAIDAIITEEPTAEEPHWILCSETTDLPDHEVLCCDLRGEMLVGYLYTDESSDTGFGAESDGECLVDCVAWREKPEPWKGE